MPIYGYKCSACDYSKDVLQKMNDEPLVTCPNCHTDGFKKQVSAPSFRLAGSGWYETDFKTGDKKNLVRDKEAETKNTKSETSHTQSNTDGNTKTDARTASQETVKKSSVKESITKQTPSKAGDTS